MGQIFATPESFELAADGTQVAVAYPDPGTLVSPTTSGGWSSMVGTIYPAGLTHSSLHSAFGTKSMRWTTVGAPVSSTGYQRAIRANLYQFGVPNPSRTYTFASRFYFKRPIAPTGSANSFVGTTIMSINAGVLVSLGNGSGSYAGTCGFGVGWMKGANSPLIVGRFNRSTSLTIYSFRNQPLFTSTTIDASQWYMVEGQVNIGPFVGTDPLAGPYGGYSMTAALYSYGPPANALGTHALMKQGSYTWSPVDDGPISWDSTGYLPNGSVGQLHGFAVSQPGVVMDGEHFIDGVQFWNVPLPPLVPTALNEWGVNAIRW